MAATFWISSTNTWVLVGRHLEHLSGGVLTEEIIDEPLTQYLVHQVCEALAVGVSPGFVA